MGECGARSVSGHAVGVIPDVDRDLIANTPSTARKRCATSPNSGRRSAACSITSVRAPA